MPGERGLSICSKDAKEKHEAPKKVTVAKQGNIWNQSLKSLELLCDSFHDRHGKTCIKENFGTQILYIDTNTNII